MLTGAVDQTARNGWAAGYVVPKRHARRAVTRGAIRRQMRAAIARHQVVLPRGEWVLRLRAPFPASSFPSATSAALSAAVRLELEQLFRRAQRAGGPS